MGDARFRGSNADQDGRFRDKDKLLVASLERQGHFPRNFSERVDLQKVNLNVFKPWVARRVEELLGFEDDIVSEYVMSILQEGGTPDPRRLQVSLTGFLEKQTPEFMKELWTLLLDAQRSIGGIPQAFVEEKKRELREAREKDERTRMQVKPEDRKPEFHRERRSEWDKKLGPGEWRRQESDAQRPGDRRREDDWSRRTLRQRSRSPEHRKSYDRSDRSERQYHDRRDNYRPRQRTRSPEYLTTYHRTDRSDRQQYDRRDDSQSNHLKHLPERGSQEELRRRERSRSRSLTPVYRSSRRSPDGDRHHTSRWK